jgi:hypothetical protein
MFCASSLGIAFFFGGGEKEEEDLANLEFDEEEDAHTCTSRVLMEMNMAIFIRPDLT